MMSLAAKRKTPEKAQNKRKTNLACQKERSEKKKNKRRKQKFVNKGKGKVFFEQRIS